MKAIGWTATVIAGVIGLAAVAMIVESLPDIVRYLRIRRM